jgi:hypothetical protein
VKAVHDLDRLDRHTVRATFDRRFTARRMADDYLDLYRALAGRAQRVLPIHAANESGAGPGSTRVA